MKLGKIKKVELRDCWKNETSDFTPWLAKEENISLLGETIGMDLEVRGQEENVGPFRADILCVDTATNQYVLIENQLDETDHKHLGQIMTYAAGLDTVNIVWIAKHFTDEHRATLDWLNRITEPSFSFFGIEVQLLQINDSDPAPVFDIVAQPNGWSKRVRKSPSGDVSSLQKKQQEYWEEFRLFHSKQNTNFKTTKALPQHWMNISMGTSAFGMSLNVNSRDKNICICINLFGNSKNNFDYLQNKYESESKEYISPNLIWDRLEGRKQSIIYLLWDTDFLDSSLREKQFKWFIEYGQKILDFFRPKIKGLK